MNILQVTNFLKPSWESGSPARVVCKISKKLVEMEDITEEGGKAWRFVEKYSWGSIVDEFEGILEGVR